MSIIFNILILIFPLIFPLRSIVNCSEFTNGKSSWNGWNLLGFCAAFRKGPQPIFSIQLKFLKVFCKHSILHSLVVWNMNFIFPNQIGDDDPIWRTHIFQRGWNHQAVQFLTRKNSPVWSIPTFLFCSMQSKQCNPLYFCWFKEFQDTVCLGMFWIPPSEVQFVAALSSDWEPTKSGRSLFLWFFMYPVSDSWTYHLVN